MEVGVNVDSRLGFRAADIAAPGVTWVRTVITPHDDLGPWIEDCHAHGLKVLGVIARESFRRGWTYKSAARYYNRFYGPGTHSPTFGAFQIGNEPDLRSPSSWMMRPERLNRLLRAFRTEMPGAQIIGPGLASGQASYLDGVSLGEFDFLGVHGYGQRPNDTEDWSDLPGNFGYIGDLLDTYARFGKKIWMTEIGLSTDQVSEPFQARYLSAMLDTISRRSDVEALLWFVWSDLSA